MNVTGLYVIATGPHGFPGASQILCEYLRQLVRVGSEVHYVGFAVPFLYQVSGNGGTQCHIVGPLAAGAIGPGRAIASSEVLSSAQITECIVRLALDNRPDDSPLILWGTYLFPYGQATVDAARLLSQSGVKAMVWLTPTGSDIWEIAPHLKYLTRGLLNDESVSHIITYTGQFAFEIQERFGMDLRIQTLYPVIDFSRFHSLPVPERTKRKLELGIEDDAFVITSHSNMRPIKAPEDVLHIAARTASRLRQKLVVLMIGPDLPISPDLDDIPNLEIQRCGVVKNVERLLQVSDLELNCSRHDSFNLSLAEAMACGVPCATTNVVGIAPEIARSGGVMFPVQAATDPNSSTRYGDAVDEIVALVADDRRRHKIASTGCEIARNQFSAQNAIPRLLCLARSVNRTEPLPSIDPAVVPPQPT